MDPPTNEDDDMTNDESRIIADDEVLSTSSSSVSGDDPEDEVVPTNLSRSSSIEKDPVVVEKEDEDALGVNAMTLFNPLDGVMPPVEADGDIPEEDEKETAVDMEAVVVEEENVDNDVPEKEEETALDMDSEDSVIQENEKTTSRFERMKNRLVSFIPYPSSKESYENPLTESLPQDVESGVDDSDFVQELKKEKQFWSIKTLKLCLISLIILVFILIIVLASGTASGFLGKPKKALIAPTISPTITRSNSPSETPTSGPTFSPTRDAMEHLFSYGFFDIMTAQEINFIRRSPESVQHKSAEWLTNDPKFWSYNSTKLVQRWVFGILAIEWTATGGSHIRPDQLPLESWGKYTDECSWFMSWNQNTHPCSTQNGEMKQIYLTNVGLQGTIPSEIRFLTKLSKCLSKDDHILFIEVSLTAFFSSLDIFVLKDNKISGTLPWGLGTMNKLGMYNEHKNLMHTIPEQI